MTQNEALSILKIGANVFLTGEPGSGKTHIVDLYIRYLRDHGIGVAVTASTGIAATHLGGMTIHSWSGIGIKKSLSASDISKMQKNRRLTSRAQKTSVLVIDEISMLDASTLEAVDIALKTLRESKKSFGGMQIVFVGDFFQLPPVVQKGEEFSGFSFKSLAWNEANPVICYLTEQHRHKDLKFINILSSIRSKDNIQNVHSFLSSRKVNAKSTEVTMQLYSHNVDVDKVNNERLKSLPGNEYVFQMSSRGAKPLVVQLKKSCLSPEILTLKMGAQVMFTKNSFGEGFINGTLGEIVGFDDERPVVVIKSGQKIVVEPVEWEVDDGVKALASITQYPLRLAWAITVHKSQGMTLDAAVIDLSGAFEYGQGYVAISRVRSLSGLFLLGINERALEVHPEVVSADANFRLKSERARNHLSKYSQSELRKKQNEFILSSGGKLTKVVPKSKISTYEQTLQMYKSGKNISEIASTRGLKEGTIVNHIEKLSPVFEKLNGKYTYDELRLARLVMNYLK